MTDRHLHCVYFKYDDPNCGNGRCLLKEKKIEFGFKKCCEDIVLRPVLLLSYYLTWKCGYTDWVKADKEAIEFIDRYKINDYPKGDYNEEKDKRKDTGRD